MKTYTLKTLLFLCLSLGVSQLWSQTTTYNYTGTIETYTVPDGVNSISIQAYGAQGGNENGGLGASMYGEFSVTPGQVLNIVVGQQGVVNNCGGADASGGGGGGSFVWDPSDAAAPMVAAGGGGGGNQNWTGDCTNGVNGQAGTDGTSGSEGEAAGGSDGQGGAGNAPSGTGAGGGGWLSNGETSIFDATATGGATLPDFAGGDGSNTYGPGGEGGYGGGGGAVCGCGGGGGYSGGAGGNGSTCRAGGGGGGSYNEGTNQSNVGGIRMGNGQISITASCWQNGNGSDGPFLAQSDFDFTSGTYNYTSFTIEDGVTVSVVGNEPLIIYCTGTATIDGALSANGGDGMPGITFDTYGAGGIGVAGGGNGGDGYFDPNLGPENGFDGSNIGGENTFGTNWSGAGGAGHANPGMDTGEPLGGFGGIAYGTADLTPSYAGSGAGGGSGGNNCGSGGGGAGGGIITFFATDIIIGANGSINANGGNGGSDGEGNCGGGGGGSGGTIHIAAINISHNGEISTAGGTGGSTSQGIDSFGTGGDGSVGRIRVDAGNFVTGSGTYVPDIGYSTVLLDNGISQDGNTLMADQADAEYVWVDCNNANEPILGETSQSFSPNESGTYACIVSDGECEVITDCFDFTYDAVVENTANSFNLYPNPVHDNIVIQVNGTIDEIRIYNSIGSLVQVESEKSFSVENLSNGMYMISIKTDKGMTSSRFTKE